MATRDFLIKTYFDRELMLDADASPDDAETPRLPLRIRRFSVAQLQAFLPGFERMVNPPSERIFARQADGPEQEQDEQRRYRMPFTEVRRRRLAEMTAEQRAAFDVEAQADQAAILAFCTEVVAQHVWLPPDVSLRVQSDGGGTRKLRTGLGVDANRPGAELAEAFSGNLLTLMAIVQMVADDNMLSAAAKKVWRSSPSSRPSSSGPQDRGARPETTAGNAATAASARRGRASARRRRPRSGAAAT